MFEPGKCSSASTFFKSVGTPSTTARGTDTDNSRSPSTRIQVDKWLLLRFSVAFVVLRSVVGLGYSDRHLLNLNASAFEICIIMLESTRYSSSRALAHADGPDLLVDGTIMAILGFLRGVTTSLLAFCLFGTTASFRKRYADAFIISISAEGEASFT